MSLAYHRIDRSPKINEKTNSKLTLLKEDYKSIEDSMYFLLQMLKWVLISVSFSISSGTIALIK